MAVRSPDFCVLGISPEGNFFEKRRLRRCADPNEVRFWGLGASSPTSGFCICVHTDALLAKDDLRKNIMTTYFD
jgi:hypothetical protein